MDDKIEELKSQSGSYGKFYNPDGKRVSFSDKHINSLKEQIAKTQDYMNNISSSNNRLLKDEKLKTSKKLQRLRNKLGKVEARQKKIMNTKVKSDIRKLFRESKVESKQLGHENVALEYEVNSELYRNKAEKESNILNQPLIKLLDLLVTQKLVFFLNILK